MAMVIWNTYEKTKSLADVKPKILGYYLQYIGSKSKIKLRNLQYNFAL